MDNPWYHENTWDIYRYPCTSMDIHNHALILMAIPDAWISMVSMDTQGCHWHPEISMDNTLYPSLSMVPMAINGMAMVAHMWKFGCIYLATIAGWVCELLWIYIDNQADYHVCIVVLVTSLLGLVARFGASSSEQSKAHVQSLLSMSFHSYTRVYIDICGYPRIS